MPLPEATKLQAPPFILFGKAVAGFEVLTRTKQGLQYRYHASSGEGAAGGFVYGHLSADDVAAHQLERVSMWDRDVNGRPLWLQHVLQSKRQSDPSDSAAAGRASTASGKTNGSSWRDDHDTDLSFSGAGQEEPFAHQPALPDPSALHSMRLLQHESQDPKYADATRQPAVTDVLKRLDLGFNELIGPDGSEEIAKSSAEPSRGKPPPPPLATRPPDQPSALPHSRLSTMAEENKPSHTVEPSSLQALTSHSAAEPPLSAAAMADITSQQQWYQAQQPLDAIRHAREAAKLWEEEESSIPYQETEAAVDELLRRLDARLPPAE